MSTRLYRGSIPDDLLVGDGRSSVVEGEPATALPLDLRFVGADVDTSARSGLRGENGGQTLVAARKGGSGGADALDVLDQTPWSSSHNER